MTEVIIPKKAGTGETIEMVYVGTYTRGYLFEVRAGRQSLPTYKRERAGRYVPGDSILSLDEAIDLLERQQGTEKSQEELLRQMRYYEIGALYTQVEPDAYVQPEIAYAWYKQQIERIRSLLTPLVEN
jgi:hypothetical protein